MNFLSDLVDRASEYFAHRKGLLPTIGLIFILINFGINVLAFITPVPEWLLFTNLFLHLGIFIAIFGLMLAWAL
jgi:hypothetical protein